MVGHKLVGVLYAYTGYVGACYGFFLSALIRFAGSIITGSLSMV